MAADKELLDRLPPQNREAEQSVLGAMLRDNACINDLLQLLRKEDFYTDSHQKVFETIISLHDRGGQPVDLVILAEELKKRGYLEDVGGYAYLAELWEATPTSANAEYYGQIVRDKSLVRNLIRAGNDILGDAYKQSMPADQMIEGAERKIMEVANKGIIGKLYTLDEAIQDTYDRIDQRTQGSEMASGGIPTGFTDLDELTAGLHRSELVIIAARPSVGKCLTADAEIVLADGSIATIEDLYRHRQVQLLTLGDDWRLRLTAPTAYVDDGVKPVYRVTTRLGRTIETTASHPFRTFDGWRPLASLTPGDLIAVPRRIPVFGDRPMRECEVKLLAYLIGDGGLTDTTPEFTNANPRLRAEFAEAAAAFGGVRCREDDGHGRRTPTLLVASNPTFLATGRQRFAANLRARLTARGDRARTAAAVGVTAGALALWQRGRTVPDETTFARLCATLQVVPDDLAPGGVTAIRKNAPNALTRWLMRLGLWGKGSREKFIPAEVFCLPEPQLALFLNRLFATDGWATVLGEGQTQLGYASVSERLARQVQHLLLRFGILASLRRREVKYRDSRRPAWQLDVTEQTSVRAFVACIGLFGKEAALTRVAERLAAKRPKACRDVVPPAVWSDLERAKGATTWSEIATRAGLPAGTNLHVGRRGLSRRRLRRLADAVGSEPLRQLAESDVYWDRIVAIEPAGHKQVYDLTIPETHNFVANDVCVHNTAFALSLARNIIVHEQEPVFFVSLEQSRIELAERLLCAQAKVDSHRLRKGTLTADDMERLIEAGGVLRSAPLTIDDTPAQGMLRIAANARRLKRQRDIKVVIIDYLQLIEPDNRRDPRHEQVAQISRRLKFLARELEIPVIALAQVNRASEDRQDHRPRLSDLRESGCLAGDTLVTQADSGRRVPIRELVGRQGTSVWSLDEQTLKLRPAEVSRAFRTGVKPVYRLRTRLGRCIRATANHSFRTYRGWKRLDELAVGEHLAVPRALPCGEAETMTVAEAGLLGHLIGDGCTLPRHAVQYTTRERDLADRVAGLAIEVFAGSVSPRVVAERTWFQVYLTAAERLTHGRHNPVAGWLAELRAFGLRSWEKRVPDSVFEQPREVAAAFLRGLWATDGCIRPAGPSSRYPAVYYASSSEALADGVQALLLRLGINGRRRIQSQGGKGRPQHQVWVSGREDLALFAREVGATGAYRCEALAAIESWLVGQPGNTNRDVVPRFVWHDRAVPLMRQRGISMRCMQAALGTAFCGSSLYKRNLSRERLARVTAAVGGDEALTVLASSDVYWDRVAHIEPAGVEEVFDLTVPGTHNFVANEIVVHNSIEQDADAVLMLHRPDRYEPGQQEGIIEIIVAKNRQGPVGEITLAYIKQHMRYEDFKVGSAFDS